MKIIRWASIGCGNVCEVKSLPGMYKLPYSKVMGVYARNQQNAADFIKRHGLPKVYGSVEELLQDDEVDIVYIATPPHTHMQYALQALDAGKHVYVEKPMAMDFAESKAMQEHAQLRQRHLFVAHYRRALPYFNKVKSLLQQGIIGKLVSVKLEQFKHPSPGDMDPANLPWRLKADQAGGGYFYDLAPHAIDVLSYIVDEPYAEVHGFANNRGGWYEVEDTLSAVFKMKSGLHGTAQWSFATSPFAKKDAVTFLGTEGSIVCSIFSFAPIEVITAGGTEFITTEHPAHIQMPLIKMIVDELNGIGTCPANAATALSTAWAMDRIMQKV